MSDFMPSILCTLQMEPFNLLFKTETWVPFFRPDSISSIKSGVISTTLFYFWNIFQNHSFPQNLPAPPKYKLTSAIASLSLHCQIWPLQSILQSHYLKGNLDHVPPFLEIPKWLQWHFNDTNSKDGIEWLYKIWPLPVSPTFSHSITLTHFLAHSISDKQIFQVLKCTKLFLNSGHFWHGLPYFSIFFPPFPC